MGALTASACLVLLVTSPVLCQHPQCPTSSPSGVHFSVSSYRNVSGHWISQAAVTRRSSGEVVGQETEERAWQYEVDIARIHCAEQDSLTTTLHIAVPPPRVGSDYTFFPGVGYYKLHTTKVTWESARKTCSEEGAHLAIVNSEAEENAIRKVMEQNSNDSAFIGFHDKFKEGEYVTVLGQPLGSTGRVRWAPSQPNNVVSADSPEGQDCGIINLDGSLNDAGCSLELAFVCEQSI